VHIQLFGKQNCGKCESTKKKLEHFVSKYGNGVPIEVTFFDLGTVDGLAEGAFRDVFKVPTTIIQDDGRDLVRWEGEIPDSEILKAQLAGKA
jgi:thiol-disulfide isomerase/thioredoxin